MKEPEIPKAFEAVFRELVIAFQPRGLERETVRVYWSTLGELPADVLWEAARRLTRSKTFFPTTGEWFHEASVIQRERIRAIAGLPHQDVVCDRCGDTGSVLVDCPGDATCGRPRQHAAHGFVCLCVCRPTNLAYQQKVAAAQLAAIAPEE